MGVGEVLWRIDGKAVMLFKNDKTQTECALKLNPSQHTGTNAVACRS